MNGIVDLQILLSSMDPVLSEESFVFCSLKKELHELVALNPWAIINEDEGQTVILNEKTATENDLSYQGVFRRITLNVHSSLEAVGLTAVLAKKLTEYNISANVVAGYYHDHLFVKEDVSEQAIEALKELKATSYVMKSNKV